jgi:hypothetical protein
MWVALILLTAARTATAEPLQSGPQVGQALPGPFQPFNVTGPWAGTRHCLYCENGMHPVALVFARDVTPEVSVLLKKLDAAVAAHSDCHMGAFAVFCNDDPAVAGRLKTLGTGLQRVILSTFSSDGPAKYHVARNAEVTVVLYYRARVLFNFAFHKGELTGPAVEAILARVPQISPQD